MKLGISILMASLLLAGAPAVPAQEDLFDFDWPELSPVETNAGPAVNAAPPAAQTAPPAGRPAPIDWAPFYSCDTDVNGDARWRILGPIFEGRQAPDGKSLWAARPVITTIRDPKDEREESDVVWPLLIRKLHRNSCQWRLAVLGVWRDFDVTDPNSRYSLWLLPIYFQGRGKDGRPYFAILPFGGKISDILTWDEVWVALFPLYSYARVDDVESRSCLWPILSRTSDASGSVQRARIWPFYGYSIRQDDFDKRFVAWPIWTSARYYYPNSSGYAWILFPLTGHVGLSDQESWMFLPPFIRFSNSTQLRQINCPWPFFQYSSGLIDKLYFWPVIGSKDIGPMHTAFLFWPVGLTTRRETAEIIDRRYYIVPIVFSETMTRPAPAGPAAAAAPAAGEVQPAAGEVAARTLKVWPLFSYQRANDYYRFRFPSLCPVRDFPVIERNYAPLWTLYTRSACGAVTEDELLWGLVQYRRSEEGLLKTSLFPLFSVERAQAGAPTEWSVLKGLIGRERDGDQNRIRLLYFIRW